MAIKCFWTFLKHSLSHDILFYNTRCFASIPMEVEFKQARESPRRQVVYLLIYYLCSVSNTKCRVSPLPKGFIVAPFVQNKIIIIKEQQIKYNIANDRTMKKRGGAFVKIKISLFNVKQSQDLRFILFLRTRSVLEKLILLQKIAWCMATVFPGPKILVTWTPKLDWNPLKS